MRRLILICALALTACGKAEEPRTPPAPPDAVLNAAQPLDASGGSPAWGLKIRGQQFTLDQPGEAQMVATAPGAVVMPGKMSWTPALPDGRTFKVTIYSSLCSDGVSDIQYSYSAEITLPDQSLLAGCAGPPAKPVQAHAQGQAQAGR